MTREQQLQLLLSLRQNSLSKHLPADGSNAAKASAAQASFGGMIGKPLLDMQLCTQPIQPSSRVSGVRLIGKEAGHSLGNKVLHNRDITNSILGHGHKPGQPWLNMSRATTASRGRGLPLLFRLPSCQTCVISSHWLPRMPPGCTSTYARLVPACSPEKRLTGLCSGFEWPQGTRWQSLPSTPCHCVSPGSHCAPSWACLSQLQELHKHVTHDPWRSALTPLCGFDCTQFGAPASATGASY